MTYGQTSSGKTYTLFGTDSNPGMITRFLKQLFEKQKDIESYDDCQLAVKYSFFEIYNEKVYDLLGKDSFKKLHL
jgi:centromeric protein E